MVARDEGTVVLAALDPPGALGADDDEQRRKARKDAKVTAILHESYPVRWWDDDLGPDEVRLLAGRVPADPAAGTGDRELGRIALRDLTPSPGPRPRRRAMAISPDGRTVVTTWQRPSAAAGAHPGRDRHRHRGPARPPRRPVRGVRRPRVLPRRAPARGARGAALDRRRAARHPARRPRPGAAASAPTSRSGWDRWPGPPAWTPDGARSCSPPTTRALAGVAASTPRPATQPCG